MDEYITIDGQLYKKVVASDVVRPDDGFDSESHNKNCTWYIQNGGQSWKCRHNISTTKHPFGYCNGGCCR